MSRHGLTRRETLSLLMSGAAAAACTRDPHGYAVPWVERPPDVVPGEIRHYATSMMQDGYAFGLLVQSREGRPTKIEGNPLHPASLGGTGPREQASVLGLYDPNRGRMVREGDQPRAFAHLARHLRELPADGRGVHVLLEPTSSLVHARLIARLRAERPRLRVHHHAPLLRREALDGMRIAFGRPLEQLPRMAELKRLLTIGADPIGAGPSWVRQARAFATTRRDAEHMSRLYAVEPSFTLTGAKADERIAVPPSRMPAALAIAARQILPEGPIHRALARFELPHTERRFVEIAAEALEHHRGEAALLVGDRQPAWMHALAALVNGHLRAPIDHVRSPLLLDLEGLDPLIEALDAGEVETLLLLGGNPAYGAPGDLRLPERLRLASSVVRLGMYEDETSGLADWYCPALHFLESWGDGRAPDGTISLVQPLIAPMYNGHSVAELLAVLAGLEDVSERELLEQVYGEALPEALRTGILPQSAFPVERPELQQAAIVAAVAAADPVETEPLEIELEVRPSPRVHDGRYANNPWLQELPDPFTKQSWGSAAILAPPTADRLGLESGDVVALHKGDAVIVTPIVTHDGQAEDTITVELGYGRAGEEVVAAGIGVDVSPLRNSGSPWTTHDIGVEKLDEREDLAVTQMTFHRHDRGVAKSTTPHHLEKGEPPGERRDERLRMYAREGQWDRRLEAPNQWGMAVDMATCIGCQACVIACQSENNIPIVGETDVRKGREMYWLRIDRYEDGPPGSPHNTWQPMLCQHCELAPCEYVCPVNATVHSPDGLNEMIYNRCVGTRFCSNNCPYKVRRFNYYDWHTDTAYVRTLQLNPEVTVRDRGVMEKCTFCVQRIRTAEIEATTEGRDLEPGEVVTACQSACPTEAIVFGDLRDPDAPVVRWFHHDRAYDELGELGTFPRVRYLVDLRHPDPEISGEEA